MSIVTDHRVYVRQLPNDRIDGGSWFVIIELGTSRELSFECVGMNEADALAALIQRDVPAIHHNL